MEYGSNGVLEYGSLLSRHFMTGYHHFVPPGQGFPPIALSPSRPFAPSPFRLSPSPVVASPTHARISIMLMSLKSDAHSPRRPLQAASDWVRCSQTSVGWSGDIPFSVK